MYRNDAAALRVAVRLRGLRPNGAGIGALERVRGGPAPMQMQEILCGGHYLSCDLGDGTGRLQSVAGAAK